MGGKIRKLSQERVHCDRTKWNVHGGFFNRKLNWWKCDLFAIRQDKPDGVDTYIYQIGWHYMMQDRSQNPKVWPRKTNFSHSACPPLCLCKSFLRPFTRPPLIYGEFWGDRSNNLSPFVWIISPFWLSFWLSRNGKLRKSNGCILVDRRVLTNYLLLSIRIQKRFSRAFSHGTILCWINKEEFFEKETAQKVGAKSVSVTRFFSWHFAHHCPVHSVQKSTSMKFLKRPNETVGKSMNND